VPQDVSESSHLRPAARVMLVVVALRDENPRRRFWYGAVAGLLAAAVALAVGELVAGLVRPESAPVSAVGSGLIKLAPEQVKDFAIRSFGSNDKTALVAGVLVVLAVLAAVLGVLADRRRWIGYSGIGLLGVVGVVAALTQAGAGGADVLPSLLGAAAGAGTLALLLRRSDEMEIAAGTERRRFLGFAAGSAVVAGLAGLGGRALQTDRFAASRSRAAVRIPRPASPAGPLPSGVDLKVPGTAPWRTGNAGFYRVDTALSVPQLTADTWRLQIHGKVDNPFSITYRELLEMPLIERDITLCCVSNPVGGSYIGNARWIGAPLRDILRRAGVHDGANQVVSRSSDGMTIGTPTAVLTDGRDAMLAVAMNGEPLPVDHGFPVRMVVPGLYGYVSACKWIVDIELTTFAAYDAYWVPRGYSAQAPVKTESRIDTPRDGANPKAGAIQIAGVAWAQHRGISKVEVQVDGGPWQQARLAAVPSADTWRQWVRTWQATPGDHTLRVRATDATGATQPARQTPVYPNGATGYHEIRVTVG
jgi:DMSO/TMAO reductase YedYZ molybdopterin-dependent catalytic subunit